MGSGQLYRHTVQLLQYTADEQLYRQRVVPKTADCGSSVQKVPAINEEGGGVPLLLCVIHILWFTEITYSK